MNAIKIRGLEVSACHGVLAKEKTAPQKFVFDIDLVTDFYRAFKEDDLAQTVNYSKVCDTVVEIAQNNCFDLIETLAYTCAHTVLNNFNVREIELTVYKPQAPVKHKFENIGVTVKLERERAYLSLGSSMGDRAEYLNKALGMLDATDGVAVKKVSSFIQTEPYGGVAKNTFLNCAAEIETFLSPQELLCEIHRIEEACGRVRKERWGDRTLDIDIVFYGSEVICTDTLTIPHPGYCKRDFVLQPLKEIAGDFVCPLLKKRISDL